VSLRRFCEALPVDADSQAKRLAREAAKGARWACTVKMTVHDSSGREQEMFVGPRRSIPMVAATISLASVREDLRVGVSAAWDAREEVQFGERLSGRGILRGLRIAEETSGPERGDLGRYLARLPKRFST
jgi:hypothetical protein